MFPDPCCLQREAAQRQKAEEREKKRSESGKAEASGWIRCTVKVQRPTSPKMPGRILADHLRFQTSSQNSVGPSPGKPKVLSNSNCLSCHRFAILDSPNLTCLNLDLSRKAKTLGPSKTKMSLVQLAAHRRIGGKHAISKSSSMFAGTFSPAGSLSETSLVGSSATLSRVGTKGTVR